MFEFSRSGDSLCCYFVKTYWVVYFANLVIRHWFRYSGIEQPFSFSCKVKESNKNCCQSWHFKRIFGTGQSRKCRYDDKSFYLLWEKIKDYNSKRIICTRKYKIIKKKTKTVQFLGISIVICVNFMHLQIKMTS